MDEIKVIINDWRIHFPNEIKWFDETKKENFLIKRDGLMIWDMDKYKVRPYVKDFLNRQNQFIEIKYLFIILIVSIICIFSIILTYVFSPGKWFIQWQIQTMSDATNKKIDSISTLLTDMKNKEVQANNDESKVQEIKNTTETSPIIHYNVPTHVTKPNEFTGGL